MLPLCRLTCSFNTTLNLTYMSTIAGARVYQRGAASNGDLGPLFYLFLVNLHLFLPIFGGFKRISANLWWISYIFK